MIRREFSVHLLNERGIDRAKRLGEAFSALLDVVEEVSGSRTPGDHQRELALVRTKLQEASFFAKRAMAMTPENQKEPE